MQHISDLAEASHCAGTLGNAVYLTYNQVPILNALDLGKPHLKYLIAGTCAHFQHQWLHQLGSQ